MSIYVISDNTLQKVLVHDRIWSVFQSCCMQHVQSHKSHKKYQQENGGGLLDGQVVSAWAAHPHTKPQHHMHHLFSSRRHSVWDRIVMEPSSGWVVCLQWLSITRSKIIQQFLRTHTLCWRIFHGLNIYIVDCGVRSSKCTNRYVHVKIPSIVVRAVPQDLNLTLFWFSILKVMSKKLHFNDSHIQSYIFPCKWVHVMYCMYGVHTSGKNGGDVGWKQKLIILKLHSVFFTFFKSLPLHSIHYSLSLSKLIVLHFGS